MDRSFNASGNSSNTGNGSTFGGLETALGVRLLAYILSCGEDEAHRIAGGELTPSETQRNALDILSVILQHTPGDLAEAERMDAVKHWSISLQSTGKTNAGVLRELTNGPEEFIETTCDMEEELATIAVDAYPAYIASERNQALQDHNSILKIETFGAVLAHPHIANFQEATLSDSVFERVYREEIEHAGYIAAFQTNTDVNISIPLSVLPQYFLHSAWRTEHSRHSAQAFAREAVARLQVLRDAISGSSAHITVMQALTGVSLPPGTEMVLDERNSLRCTNEMDLDYIPSELLGQRSHSDAEENIITGRRSGDVVLEHRFPYVVQPKQVGDVDGNEWVEPNALSTLNHTIERLQLSLIFANDRQQHPQIAPTWRFFDSPLNMSNVAWSQLSILRGIGLTSLSDTEIAQWVAWYERVSSPAAKSIEIAISRVVRAFSERRDPADILIDSVIAWENMFGVEKVGYSDRMANALATLLDDKSTKLKDQKKYFKSIYKLRNDVVHGNVHIDRQSRHKCVDALDIALRAIQLLVGDRVDVLKLPSGDERCSKVLTYVPEIN